MNDMSYILPLNTTCNFFNTTLRLALIWNSTALSERLSYEILQNTWAAYQEISPVYMTNQIRKP